MKIVWEDLDWCWAGFAGETWIATVTGNDTRGYRWELNALQASRHSFAKAGRRSSTTEARRACQRAWDRFLNECGLVAKEPA